MKEKHILVTGGAGFIGSNLVEMLAKDNTILVMDNMHTGIVSNLDGLMDKIQLRVLDTEDIFEVDFSPDVIFHLGMYSSTPMYKENRSLVHKVVDGTMKVLEFAKKAGSRVVVASSSSIYNGHPTPQREDMIPMITDFYTEARLSAERLTMLYAKLFGLKTTCLRFFSVYGPREGSKGSYANLVSQFIWDLQAGRTPTIYGDGTQTRDFVYVKDVVEACVKSAESANTGIYNVGTGKSYSVNQMLEKVMDRMGIHLEPRLVPMPVSNYVMHTLADTTKAKRELGFEARYTLDDGLRLMLPEKGAKTPRSSASGGKRNA
ncbi:MAG: NAD-dependent epimerase/dehydratase family protein [Nitrososphaerales archaeon]|jgi:UDP-glucose 4-epimerase